MGIGVHIGIVGMEDRKKEVLALRAHRRMGKEVYRLIVTLCIKVTQNSTQLKKKAWLLPDLFVCVLHVLLCDGIVVSSGASVFTC